MIGGRVGLGDWLRNMVVCLPKDGHPFLIHNWSKNGVNSLMQPTLLPWFQAATAGRVCEHRRVIWSYFQSQQLPAVVIVVVFGDV